MRVSHSSLWFLGLAAVAAAAGGCIGSRTKPCGNQVCPSGFQCHAVHGCVRPEQLADCAGRADGEICQLGDEQGYHCADGVCVLGACGDGFVDPFFFEACDNGPDNNDTAPNACRTNCQPARCGDGTVDASEVCDDGNVLSGDGCSGDCASVETCGNGYVDALPGEQCDDGNERANDGCDGTCKVEVPLWLPKFPSTAPLRSDHALAYEAARGVTVLFGGVQTDNKTYEYRGTQWVQTHPITSPPPRGNAAMIYDEARGRVVLFGGVELDMFDDTWEYDGVTWTEVNTAVAPSPRDDHAMAYNAARGVTVLMGGRTGLDHHDDTWEYDGAQWTEVIASGPLAPRSGHAMTYDALRQKVVLFGGEGAQLFSDTWEYDGTWSQTSVSNSPDPGSHQMAYDTARGVTLLLESPPGTRTWEYDGLDWALQSPPTTGPNDRGKAMVYDRDRGYMVVYGGTNAILGVDLNTTTEYVAGDWFTPTDPPTEPQERHATAATYDNVRRRTLLFGGTPNTRTGVLKDQWLFDGTSWLSIELGHRPPPTHRAAMVYDSARERIVFLLSASGAHETWEWTGQRWFHVPIANPSPLRGDGALIYDSARQRTVLFSGNAGTADTWEYDGLAWTAMTPTASPPARAEAAAAFDPVRGRAVIFGGQDGSTEFADTWEYDGTTWTQTGADATPLGGRGYRMVWNPPRRRLLLFGLAPSGAGGTTWEYDGSGWSRLETSVNPPGRMRHGMAYDIWRDRALIVAGHTGDIFLSDTWEFQFGSGPPEAVCTNGVDDDGDGALDCADPDCATRPECAVCGDGSCHAVESCERCPGDCGSCAGCSIRDVLLSQVSGGSLDFIELTNRGNCDADLGGVTLLFRVGCDAAPQAYTFPRGTMLAPSAVLRAVEGLGTPLANEIQTGAPMCRGPAGGGWVMACDGFCDLGTCGNVLDYVELQGAAGPVSPPACASFSPAPVDMSGAGATEAARRVDFTGSGAAGVQADWSLGTATRN